MVGRKSNFGLGIFFDGRAVANFWLVEGVPYPLPIGKALLIIQRSLGIHFVNFCITIKRRMGISIGKGK